MVTLTYLGQVIRRIRGTNRRAATGDRARPDSLTLKTSTLKFEAKEYTPKNFNANDFHAILRRMSEPSDAAADAAEPSLKEQIAAYQREFQDLDPQVEQVVSALQRLNRRMNVAYGRQTATLGLSNAEWEVLKALVVSGAPYQLGPGELAKRLGLTPAAMTHRIDRMASEGLVTRERDEANRVRVIVELTGEGREKWLEAMRLASVFEEDLLQDLNSEERQLLGQVLTRLLRRVEDAQPDADGRLSDLD
ncbi:DNA-binding MarR family transcriptional regulator [Streptomyces sp. 2333.5]|nr:DNA-binding MarR family transcriptional regulator [Streptomyces sp. 2333.5]SED70147.1 DNA-binding transcriptional regulator, MarR family [Streptomyces sp. 2314.4]SEE18650.1 DNA-binding transcriptional regulator, MarR family [Streptomyces sp. 2112.2]SOE12785.1 DNA-binding transcriptional regulator, MarR family [Streptomyces sp. 2323.1]